METSQQTPKEPEVPAVQISPVESWHAPLNKVTLVSKILAGVVFVILPFVGFWLGQMYAPSSVAPVALPISEKVVDVVKKVTAEQVSWNIELANPTITDEDDFKKYQQVISVNVTFSGGNLERYSLGFAYGCVASSTAPFIDKGKKILGIVNCYFALSDIQFVAYLQNERFIINRNEVSARDGSIETTVLLEM